MTPPLFDPGQIREDIDFEAKLAAGRDGKGKLPDSFFETYSAFANTEGGIVMLGLKELGDGNWKVEGIQEPDRVIDELWKQLNDRNKVSRNLLRQMDVRKVEVDSGRWLVEIEVPRAPRRERPVYIGKNPLRGTYKRLGEGDFHCTEEEVRRMLAEQTEDARDARVLEGFSMDDLEMETFRAYRARLAAAKPDHPFNNEDNPGFLKKIGGWKKDRDKGVEGLTLAGLLMFGKQEAIEDALANYFVDYREVPDESSQTDWVDRLVPDGTWSGNLYDFYRFTIQRLFQGLKVPFKLEGDERLDDTPVHKALREALVNTIIHADYSARVSLLVIKGPAYFGFRNPGKMRIPVMQALEGGTSDSRNRNIQKMFSLINLGEQAGSGIPRVVENWKSQHFRSPELWEKDEPESTWMRLRMVSLLPEETLGELAKLCGANFKTLDENQRLALATAHIEKFVTNARLQQVSELHSHEITSLLKGLVQAGFLEQHGQGRWTTYRLHGVEPIDLAMSEGFGVSSIGNGSSSIGKGSNSLNKRDPSLEDLEPSSIGKGEPSPTDLGGSSIGNSPSSIGNDAHKDLHGTLLEIAKPVRSKQRVSKEVLQGAIIKLCHGRFLTVQQLGEYLGRVPEDLRARVIKPMIESGELERRFPDRPNHEGQAYRTNTEDG